MENFDPEAALAENMASSYENTIAALRSRIAELEAELRETAGFAHMLCIGAGQINHTGHFEECEAMVCKDSQNILNKVQS